jgi:hypothetical protein
MGQGRPGRPGGGLGGFIAGVGLGGSVLAATPGPEVSTAPGPWLEVHRLVDDLADDPYDFNAVRALWKLPRYGEAALPALRGALGSPDWQQRQLAAHLLRGMDSAAPSSTLLAVCVEGLKRDRLPFDRPVPGRLGDRRRFMPVANATAGVLYLLRHPGPAEPHLVEGLASSDAQQRFLCAFILGTAGYDQHTPRVADILLPHLADNDIGQDALMAGSALYQLGPAVRPHLLNARPHADEQARSILDLILWDLDDPPNTPRKLRQRAGRVPISSLYHDPVHEYRFPRGGFGGIGGWDR